MIYHTNLYKLETSNETKRSKTGEVIALNLSHFPTKQLDSKLVWVIYSKYQNIFWNKESDCFEELVILMQIIQKKSFCSGKYLC